MPSSPRWTTRDSSGPVFHRLGFGEAVERDLLTDYKVLVLKVDEGFVARNFQQPARRHRGDQARRRRQAHRLLERPGQALRRRTPERRSRDDPSPMRRAVAFAQNIKASKQASSRRLPGSSSTGRRSDPTPEIEAP